MMLVLVLLVWCEFERFWSRNIEEDGKSDEYGARSTLKTLVGKCDGWRWSIDFYLLLFEDGD
jgi:hypothetical protein